MPTIVVEIMPKPELLDPAGKAVAGALARGGHTVSDVRIGKRIELTVDQVDDAALAEAQRIADELLANTVIEDVVRIYALDEAAA